MRDTDDIEQYVGTTEKMNGDGNKRAGSSGLCATESFMVWLSGFLRERLVNMATGD